MKNFWSAALLSSTLTGLRISILFIVNKLSALWLGPAGMATLGQMQNVIQVSHALGNGSLQTPMIKYAARGKAIARQYYAIFLKRSFIQLIVFFLLLYFLSPVTLFFHLPDYLLPAVLGGGVGLFFFNPTAAWFQGSGQTRWWTWSQLCIPILQVIGLSMGYYHSLEKGALIGFGLSSLASIPIFQWMLHKQGMGFLKILQTATGHQETQTWKKYLAIGLVPAILTPLSLILIRGEIIQQENWTQAGLWQSVHKISELLIITLSAVLNFYLLPQLSKSKQGLLNEHDKKTLLSTLPKLFIFTASSLGLLYLFRRQVFPIIFSTEFLPATQMLHFQFMGDIFKTLSWALAIPLVIQARVKLFLSLEILSQIIFVSLAFLLISQQGASGVPLAYLLENALYFCIILYLFRKGKV